MPILEETRKKAEKAEEQKKLIRDQELQSYSKIAEKEQKAQELLNQIKSLRVQAEADRKNCALASENTQKVRKQQETLEQKEIQWKNIAKSWLKWIRSCFPRFFQYWQLFFLSL